MSDPLRLQYGAHAVFSRRGEKAHAMIVAVFTFANDALRFADACRKGETEKGREYLIRGVEVTVRGEL
jgi:hypothetical protein